MRMKPMGLLAILPVLFGASAVWATPVAADLTSTYNLADLINNNGTILVGDKLFSGFSYAPTGDMPLATGVGVTGITLAGNLGIEFNGAFEDLAGGGLNGAASASDALIKYTVTVLDPNMVISDVHLDSNLYAVAPGILDPNNSSTILEQFTALVPPSPSIGQILVNYTYNNNPILVHDSYTWGLPGYKSISVSKDISLDAGARDPSKLWVGSISMSLVDQTFSQTSVVPLPNAATMGLSTLAVVAGLTLVRRRRLA